MNKNRQEDWERFFFKTLRAQKENDLRRNLVNIGSPPSPILDIQGRKFVHFCSNDYLGLATDSRMKEACKKTLNKWGTGACASPLISGHLSLTAHLESKIARFKHTPAAIVYCSGYSSNIGSISGLTGPDDLILSDELNHASIVDGCRLSRAEVCVYPHNDLQFIEDTLKKKRVKGKVLLVAEGVFSMDGDLAPLPQLLELSGKYHFRIYIDDAHATGVIGDSGRGTLEHFGLQPEKVIQMGTFSKALGCLGGFVCGSRSLVEYLVNKSRTLIYSTALPPPVLGAGLQALDIVENDPAPRSRLMQISRYLRNGLKKIGIPLSPGVDHIFSLVVGGNGETLELTGFLWGKRFFVPAIRPPTVPENQSRLRISLSSMHTRQQVDMLVQALQEFFRKGT